MVKESYIVKKIKRQRRKASIRKKLRGTPERPRLVVFKSLKHIYAQIVDDVSGRTLCSMSTIAKDFSGNKNQKKTDVSYEVGLQLGEKAVKTGIKQVAFDRNGYKYHGRVKALAEGARKAGLVF